MTTKLTNFLETKKKELENKLIELIKKFNEETGFFVKSVKVGAMYKIGDAKIAGYYILVEINEFE